MRCPRCNGQLRIELDELTQDKEAVCLQCGHRQLHQEEKKRMANETDLFADAKRATSEALRFAREELTAVEARVLEVKTQIKQLEPAQAAFDRSAAPKAQKTTHSWSPEARERQAERMRQRNAQRTAEAVPA